MPERIVSRYINEVKATLVETAVGAMEFAKSEPFEHGVQVGKYRGIQYALEILENIMRDNYDMESKS